PAGRAVLAQRRGSGELRPRCLAAAPSGLARVQPRDRRQRGRGHLARDVPGARGGVRDAVREHAPVRAGRGGHAPAGVGEGRDRRAAPPGPPPWTPARGGRVGAPPRYVGRGSRHVGQGLGQTLPAAHPARTVTTDGLRGMERPMREVDLVIVGAGPTGLFAAYYAGFRGLSTVVVDALPEPGGQVTAMYPEKLIFDV